MDAPENRPKKVKVMDKRGLAREPEAAPAGAVSEASEPEAGEAVAQAEQDLLDDLRRLQAEFDNYRKRMVREQTAMASRASARLIERLLPVLDNFERAISHGEGGEGVALVFKELKGALEAEGVEEIPSEGVPFDPRVHEAVESHEDENVEEPISQRVYRRGYKVKDHVIRPAMVVVARPLEAASEDVVASGSEAGDPRTEAESDSGTGGR